MARLLPDARLALIPGGGHLVVFDRAREVAPVIEAFLDKKRLRVEAVSRIRVHGSTHAVTRHLQCRPCFEHESREEEARG